MRPYNSETKAYGRSTRLLEDDTKWKGFMSDAIENSESD